MTPNETKLQNLRNYLDTLIGEYREAISSSVREMEKFNISPEDFRKESVSLNVAAFTLGYLNLAKEVSENRTTKQPRIISASTSIRLKPKRSARLA